MIVKSSQKFDYPQFVALLGTVWDAGVPHIQGLDLATGHPQYLHTSGHNEYLMNIYNLNPTSCF